MNVVVRLSTLSLSLVLLLPASLASAQPRPAGAATPRTTTVKTADYSEQVAAGGDQVVKFTGDELSGLPNGLFGDRVRALPGTVKVGLIRPRLNFVPELLKSVENL